MTRDSLSLKGTGVLVTGGAGLIGSHLADRLLAEGAKVTILDNLEPQSHPHGPPDWIPREAEFIRGDVRCEKDLARAIRGAELVFHEAAFGGFTSEASKYLEVNGEGTEKLYAALARERACRKVVVASSQAVYGEGLYSCKDHGRIRPAGYRRVEDLAAGVFECLCPSCGAPLASEAISEDAELNGRTAYAHSKIRQEQAALKLGSECRIPTVILRYALTYGPRQSVFNPYTGVVSIFSTRLLNGLPPIVYEDGQQTRDFIDVDDVVSANLLAAARAETGGLIFNVGTGRPTSVLQTVAILNELLGTRLEPEIRSFRPGDVRHILLASRKLAGLGFSPRIQLREGLSRFVSWIRTRGPMQDVFTDAERSLRSAGLVRDA